MISCEQYRKMCERDHHELTDQAIRALLQHAYRCPGCQEWTKQGYDTDDLTAAENDAIDDRLDRIYSRLNSELN